MSKSHLTLEEYYQMLEDSKVRHLNNPESLAKVKKPRKQYPKTIKKEHKYNAEPVTINGIRFASKKEGNRYHYLIMLVKSNHITDFQMQVPYDINPGGTFQYTYVADFVYTDVETKETIVEDVKGFRTPEYRKKKKLMLKVHNIKIHEI